MNSGGDEVSLQHQQTNATSKSKSEVKPPKKPRTEAEEKEFMKKYQPGKVRAVPTTMNHQASQITLLRQL